MAVSPDGQTAIALGADDTAWLWDTRTGKPLRTFRTFGNAWTGAGFSPDGVHAVLTDESTIRLRNLETCEELQHVNGRSRRLLGGVGFAPDGHRVVASGL